MGGMNGYPCVRCGFTIYYDDICDVCCPVIHYISRDQIKNIIKHLATINPSFYTLEYLKDAAINDFAKKEVEIAIQELLEEGEIFFLEKKINVTEDENF